MSTALVPGSLGAIAERNSVGLAESFLAADAIVLVDVSGSMNARDAANGQTRYAVACTELARLQSQMPGKIAVVAFSSTPTFCATGTPLFGGGSTNLAGALEFVRPADGCVRFVVVSDGQPDDPERALRVARTFTSPIDAVYIGPPDGAGERFLAELARGGQYATAVRALELATTVQKMLEAGS